MAGHLEHITKVALAEMIQDHAQSSKFGYVLTDEGFTGLVNQLYEFFETSRSLKSAGDRMLGQPATPPRMPTARIARSTKG
jgi:hypothetical protein